MIENLPEYISIVFAVTSAATLVLSVWVVKTSAWELTRKKATSIFLGMMLWLTIQAVLSLNNIYSNDTNSFPPKLLLIGILPTILLLILLFATSTGRYFIDSLPLKNLTYLNIVRIPVEIVLFWLYLYKTVPGRMTFEGQNFDIIAGVSAPIVAYLAFTKHLIGRNTMLMWNFLCLGLLINIVINALLSAPSPIQKFAFDQPNIAVLYFPFSWLPTFIVPVVLFGHIISILQLIKNKTL